MCEADGGWGEIEKMWREDEDEREGSVEKSIIPLLRIIEKSIIMKVR